MLAVHPAYLMRNGGGLSFWKEDLKQAIDILDGKPVGQWSEPTWNVLSNCQELTTLVNEYTSYKGLVSGDVETDSLNQVTGHMLSMGLTKGDGMCVDIIPEDLLYNPDAYDDIKQLMEAEGPRWNWHNGKFDIRWFWHFDRNTKARIDARVDEDTMLMSYALNSNSGFHDLDQVAQRWLKAPAHKKVVDQYLPSKKSSYRLIPPKVLYQYQAFDISKTHRMWAPLRKALEADGAETVRLYEEMLVPSSVFFARVEEYGIGVDLDVVRRNKIAHDKELQELDAQLQVWAQKHMGRNINFGSFIQLRELMYKHMQLGPPNCDWRKESTDEKHIIEVQRRHNHPMLHTLLNYREVSKRRGTYVTNMLPPAERDTKTQQAGTSLVDPDGRVRASFKVHGTITGRPACSDPNLLNVPRGPLIRGQYVAKPGHAVVEVDLNQAELRSLAVMSNDPILIKIYTENKISIHDVTTSAFYASKEQLKSDPDLLQHVMAQLQYFGEPDWKKVYGEAKMRGKAVNFGIVYGREAHSLAQEFNISFQEAQRWIDTWFETYPGAARFIKQCRDTVLRNQVMVTPFGRKKRLGVVAPEKVHALQNESANFPHQSTASDILLTAAMECEMPLRERWGAYIWNEVYDAIYFEIEADDRALNEAISYVQKVIPTIAPRYGMTRVPFIGEAKVGLTWGTMDSWKGTLAETLGENYKVAA